MEFEWDGEKAARNLTKHHMKKDNKSSDDNDLRPEYELKQLVAIRKVPEDAFVVGQTFLSAEKNHSLADRMSAPRPFSDSFLKGGVRGKYTERYRAGTNLALLAPEVRAAFPTDDAVNAALRTLMQNQAI